jgi:membrane protein DedA with SNARE-associated domain
MWSFVGSFLGALCAIFAAYTVGRVIAKRRAKRIAAEFVRLMLRGNDVEKATLQ